ncbi:hypothetical protein BC826DRAFT_976738 [Russula brevipes]|nr:hypothetical protein BC826DRAFT_976738 [Russula brevipes]
MGTCQLPEPKVPRPLPQLQWGRNGHARLIGGLGGDLGKYFECVSVKVGDMIQGIGTIAVLAMGGGVGVVGDLMCGVGPNTEDTMGIRVGDVIGGVGPNTEIFMGGIIGDVIRGIGPNTEHTMGSSVGDVVCGIGPNTEIFMGGSVGDVIHGVGPKTDITTGGSTMIAP